MLFAPRPYVINFGFNVFGYISKGRSISIVSVFCSYLVFCLRPGPLHRAFQLTPQAHPKSWVDGSCRNGVFYTIPNMLLRIPLLLCFLGGTAIAQIKDPVLLQILRNYEATLQSKVHPNGLQTMVIEGEGQKIGGEKQRFKTIRKYPNKIRNKTIDANGVELMAGSNGKTRWGRAENERKVHFYKTKV
ncbi:MAG: hypothetical protein GWO81_04380, partial [Verrucomicrobia bacterium]|nr:hypothetical protein [Verrucomicrobiota bacterium]